MQSPKNIFTQSENLVRDVIAKSIRTTINNVLVRRTPLRKSLRATLKNNKVATGDSKYRHVGTTVGQTLRVATSDYKELDVANVDPGVLVNGRIRRSDRLQTPRGSSTIRPSGGEDECPKRLRQLRRCERRHLHPSYV